MDRPRRDGESQDAVRHEEDAKHHPGEQEEDDDE